MTALCDINGYLQTWCYMRDDGQPVYFPPEEIVHNPLGEIIGA
jgi:hypothetical protein